LSPEDPHWATARLGLPPEAVRTLERRGLLWRLDLTEAEIRERLWLAHVAAEAADVDQPRPAEIQPLLRREDPR
jgi:hypothetical protein